MSLTLHIKTLTGKTISLYNIAPNATIEELKGVVEKREGIPVPQQRLIYAGKQLENFLTVAAYNIQTESTIHLVLALRGQPTSGPAPPQPAGGFALGGLQPAPFGFGGGSAFAFGASPKVKVMPKKALGRAKGGIKRRPARRRQTQSSTGRFNSYIYRVRAFRCFLCSLSGSEASAP
jgi:hypothetical protein